MGARLGGSLDLTSARIESPDGPALDSADATVEGSVFLIEDGDGNRPLIRGRLDMTSCPHLRAVPHQERHHRDPPRPAGRQHLRGGARA